MSFRSHRKEIAMNNECGPKLETRLGDDGQTSHEDESGVAVQPAEAPFIISGGFNE